MLRDLCDVIITSGITEEMNGISIVEIIEKYKGHPSIIQIENKYSGNVFTLKQVSV